MNTLQHYACKAGNEVGTCGWITIMGGAGGWYWGQGVGIGSLGISKNSFCFLFKMLPQPPLWYTHNETACSSNLLTLWSSICLVGGNSVPIYTHRKVGGWLFWLVWSIVVQIPAWQEGCNEQKLLTFANGDGQIRLTDQMLISPITSHMLENT